MAIVADKPVEKFVTLVETGLTQAGRDPSPVR
jgi:hypothetical protein